MKRKHLLMKYSTLGVIILFIGTSLYPAIAQEPEKQSSYRHWFYVGGSGPGNYTKIQHAIDNASDGDIIFVYDDSSPYNETIIINKSISLIGEKKETTIINGHHTEYDEVLINIDDASNGTVSGFTLHHEAGLLITIRADDSPGLLLSDNILDEKTDIGLLIIDCDNIRITDNLLENTSIYGINLFLSDSSLLSHNMIRSHGKYGLYIDTSNSCLIEDNFITDSISYGLFMQFCGKNTIAHNSFINNSNQSLLLAHSKGNKITENNFIGNHDSVFFIQAFFNQWSSNYWGQPRLIKFIKGFYVEYEFGPIPYPLFKLDRHPAKAPFDL